SASLLCMEAHLQMDEAGDPSSYSVEVLLIGLDVTAAMLDRADTASTVAGACGQIAAANRTYEDAVRLVQALGPEYPRHGHVHTRLVALKARLLRSAERFGMGAATH